MIEADLEEMRWQAAYVVTMLEKIEGPVLRKMYEKLHGELKWRIGQSETEALLNGNGAKEVKRIVSEGKTK